MENQKEIELKYPIIYKDKDGQEIIIRSIKFNRPKLKHARLIPKKIIQQAQQAKNDPKSKARVDISYEDLIPLIGALSGLNELVEEIDFADMEAIGDELSSFLESSL